MLKLVLRLAAPVAAGALFCAITPSRASADSLIDGQIINSLSNVGAPSLGSLGVAVDTTGTTAFSYSNVGGGTYDVNVYQGSGTGGFVYFTVTASPNSGSDIATITMGNFGAAATTVYDIATGSRSATSISRVDSSGYDHVDFQFSPVNTTGASDTYLIETDSTSYESGSIAFIDSIVSPNMPSFQPAPLPATASTGLALLGGLGVLGGVNVLRRRRQMA